MGGGKKGYDRCLRMRQNMTSVVSAAMMPAAAAMISAGVIFAVTFVVMTALYIRVKLQVS